MRARDVKPGDLACEKHLSLLILSVEPFTALFRTESSWHLLSAATFDSSVLEAWFDERYGASEIMRLE